MPYIGRPLNAGNLAVQSGTGDGSDTTPIATLDYSVGSSNSIGVYLDGVRQLAGTDFTASGTVLTFTTAPANGVGIDVYFLGLELSIPTPADATVTTAKIAANAVDETKLKDALIGDFTDATVTASDYFLHGDATDSGNTKKDTVQGILDLASGGWSFVSTVTASTASTVAFTGLEAGYDYQAVGHNLTVSTDLAYLNLQYGTGSGPSYVTSNYTNQTIRSKVQVLSSWGEAGDANIPMWADNGMGNAAGEDGSFIVTIFDPNATSVTQAIGDSYLINVSAANPQRIVFGGHNTMTTAVTALQWSLSAGTVSGKFKLYKRANA